MRFSMTEPVAARLLLVCADTGPQRRWLLDQALAHWLSPSAGRTARVIDLSGTGMEPPSRGTVPPPDWRADAGEHWDQQIWQQLIPVLQPWWELLEGTLALPDRPGRREIPGLESVLQCLYLADQCAGLHTGAAPDTLVILPPLEQALPLLQLACRGPEMLEGLWRPLLQWWSQTRQRLAQFELLLRVRLPSAESLELSERWHSSLERLAERLDPATAAAEVWLAIAAESAELAGLGRRVAALPLCGLPRLRLWLDADLPGAEADQLRQQLAMPLLIGGRARQGLDSQAWLRQSLPDQTVLWQESGQRRCCRLYLPGVQREGLQVQQIEQALQVRSAGMRLLVPMPGAWSQLACRSARIDSPWLVIEFD